MVWLGPHQLNPQSKFYFSQLNKNKENLEDYNRKEINYGGSVWWEEMKTRMENKTEKEIHLDRQLIETVGNPEMENRKIDFQKLEKLIKMGATVDHWTTIFEKGKDGHEWRWNAIDICLRSNTEDDSKCVEILTKNYNWRKNETKKERSILGGSLWLNKKLIWKRLIKVNETETALVAFLRWSGGYIDTSLEEKMEQIEEVEKRGNFAKEIQTGFKFIKENGMFQDDKIPKNIPILMKFCEQKMEPEFLQRIFGKSFKIEDQITWRYEKNGCRMWMVESFRNSGIKRKVKVKQIAGNTKVRKYIFQFERFFFIFLDFY